MPPKSKNKNKAEARKRDIAFAEDGQFYARVTKMLGGCRLLAARCDGGEVQCKIKGSLHKRVYFNVGDWILACERDGLAGSVADAVHKYTPAETQYLTRIGEITLEAKKRDGDDDDAEDLVVFADDDDAGFVDGI